MLRRIARSQKDEGCTLAEKDLKASPIWKEREYGKLVQYVETYWLPIKKRWVQAYRQDRILVNCNTNNGTERQNEALKYQMMAMKFNYPAGLQDPVLGQKLKFKPLVDIPFVQILHDGNLHWIAISTYGCADNEILYMESSFHGSITKKYNSESAIFSCAEKTSCRQIWLKSDDKVFASKEERKIVAVFVGLRQVVIATGKDPIWCIESFLKGSRLEGNRIKQDATETVYGFEGRCARLDGVNVCTVREWCCEVVGFNSNNTECLFKDGGGLFKSNTKLINVGQEREKKFQPTAATSGVEAKVLQMKWRESIVLSNLMAQNISIDWTMCSYNAVTD
eukprot:gene10259-11311_t